MGPALTRVELRCAPPGQLDTAAERGYIIHHSHTPIDEMSHIWRWTITVPKGQKGIDPAKTTMELMKEMFPIVVDQDRWALERQQKMFAFAEDGYSEVRIPVFHKSILIVRKDSARAGNRRDQGSEQVVARRLT